MVDFNFLIETFAALFIGVFFSALNQTNENKKLFIWHYSFWAGVLGLVVFLLLLSILRYTDASVSLTSATPTSIEQGILLSVLFLFIPAYILGHHLKKNSRFIFALVFGLTFYGFINHYIEVSKLGFENNFYFDSLYPLLCLTIYCISAFFISRNYRIRHIEQGNIIPHLFNRAQVEIVQQIAEAILPEKQAGAGVSAKDFSLGETLSVYLNQMSSINKIALRFAVSYLSFSPIILFFKPKRFSSLKTEERIVLLEKIEASTNFNLKMPFMMLRIFIMQSFYENQQPLDELGYNGKCMGKNRKPGLQWLHPPVPKIDLNSVANVDKGKSYK